MLIQNDIQAEIPNQIGLGSLFQNLSPVSWVVLLILLCVSIWSWGIIFSKMLLLRKIAAESVTFWKIFNKGQNLSEISTACETLRFTPLVPVFNSGAEVLEPRTARGQRPVGVATATNINAVRRAMQRTATVQLTMLENRLTFLATTASVAPFIGLFGTVWGVLIAFLGLGNESVATLKGVGPGIAEALIATAFGLAAAIPAVVAYNHFVPRVRNIAGQMDELQGDVLSIAEGEE